MIGATSRAFSRAIMRSTSSATIASAWSASFMRSRRFGVDHFLQVVDVVEEDVVELVDRRLDVARHGDVDQEHRLVAARGDDALHLVLVQDVVRRAARGDQDIHLGQHGA